LVELTKPFYSPAEVAELAGVHSSTILNYIREEKLYAVRLSERTIRIPVRSVLKLLAPESVRPPRVTEEQGRVTLEAEEAEKRESVPA
jgi:excisionase family DNA binding protein